MKPRAYKDMRPSMKKNPLLSRYKVGHAPPSTQDLPDEEFRYGYIYPKGEGVAACFNFSNASEERPHSTRRGADMDFRPKQDFVATNKAALRHGCRTAKDFREYSLSHGVMQRQDKGDLGAEAKGNFHTRVSEMTHGVATPVSSEMVDCLTWRTSREAKARALKTRELEATRMRTSGDRVNRRATAARAARPTRASRGHTHKGYVPPKESETFKMKRFLAIDHCAIESHW